MEEQSTSFDETIHASAVHFLISEKEKEAALTLLSCTLELEINSSDWNGSGYNVYLRGPRRVFEIVRDDERSIQKKY